jgi:hypothetical protein
MPHTTDKIRLAFRSWLTDHVPSSTQLITFVGNRPRSALYKAFQAGYKAGGKVHWSQLSEMQLRLLLRAQAPHKTPIPPEDLIMARMAIAEALGALGKVSTGQRQAEEALREASGRLQGLLEGQGAGGGRVEENGAQGAAGRAEGEGAEEEAEQGGDYGAGTPDDGERGVDRGPGPEESRFWMIF